MGPMSVSPVLRVGVDTGGTFTDFVCDDGESWRAFKLPSTPASPARAVLDGLAEAGDAREVVHGTTVATNAALEGRGARTAFVTTAGFRDLLALGRQARPSLYDLDQPPPPELVPRTLCFELAERVDAEGNVLRAPTAAALRSLARRVAASGADAVAVCLLFSFLRADHELAAREAMADLRLPISLSHEVLPRHREFERAVATVLNAGVTPVMAGYLRELEARLGGVTLRIMQSSGGACRPGLAARFPVHTLLSGPAGGAVAGMWAARLLGLKAVLTFDMGGTSTDVAALEGGLRMTSESSVGAWPLPVPALDIHTVGAGGGSVAFRDTGGALRVGPRSAGAEPGPACYGRTDEPTVTDAHLALGWLDPSCIAGGRVRPQVALAEEALRRLGNSLGLETLQAAEGVVRVAETSMAGALWRITCERGRDPRQFALVAFGGAGPLHACALAEKLAIPLVVVPPVPGAFSAFGMLASDLVRHATRGLARRGHAVTVEELRATLARLSAENRAELELPAGAPALEQPELLLRYAGQSYEVTVPLVWPSEEPPAAVQAVSVLATSIASFHTEHARLYGHSAPDRQVELVGVGLRTSVPGTPPSLGRPPAARRGPAAPERRRVWLGGWREAAFVRRSELPADCRLEGPAVVLEDTATTLVPPGWCATVHPSGCLLLGRLQAMG